MAKLHRSRKRARNNRLSVERGDTSRRAVSLSNHQSACPLGTGLLRRLTRTLAGDLLASRPFELEIHILDALEMARLNERYLRHAGPTDVLAFDYSDNGSGQPLRGEIFICLAEALRQARRFRTSWQSELVRYVIHGMLHLCGYDDRTTSTRRRMKRVEDAELRKLSGQYPLDRLASAPRRLQRRPPLS